MISSKGQNWYWQGDHKVMVMARNFHEVSRSWESNVCDSYFSRLVCEIYRRYIVWIRNRARDKKKSPDSHAYQRHAWMNTEETVIKKEKKSDIHRKVSARGNVRRIGKDLWIIWESTCKIAVIMKLSVIFCTQISMVKVFRTRTINFF